MASLAAGPRPLRRAPRPGRPAPLHTPPAAGADAPLRILHLARQYAPGIGGTETYIAMLTAAQRAQGHHPEVLTLDRVFAGDGARLPARDVIDGIPVRRVPFTGSERYPIAPALLRHLSGYDLIHVHCVDSIVDMVALTRIAHRRPLVLSTHGGFFHTEFAQRLKRLYFQTITRTTLAGVDAVISSSMQDQARFAPLWPAKTVPVENGVDIARFRGLATPGAKRIIYFGRIAPNKEIGRLLVWFAGLRARDAGWSLILAGKPMNVDLADVRATAERLGVADVVEIYPSPTDEALRALIARADVYACASSYEGFGIAAVEAVSAGLYPVLSDIPAFARTCDRIGFGTLVNFAAERPDLDPFLADFARFEADRPGADALDETLAPFAWGVVAQQVDAIYDRVLGRKVRRIGTLDLPVLDREGALEAILAMVADRRAQPIAFCDARTVGIARRHAAFSEALGNALMLASGAAMSLASRWLYRRRFPADLAAAGLLPDLLARLPEGTRLALIGGTGDTADAAGRRLAARYPHLVVASTGHAGSGPDQEPAVSARIAAAEPDLVLAGMEQPRQELWAARNAAALGAPVLCLGDAFGTLAGSAPQRRPVRSLAAALALVARTVAQRAAGRRGLR